MIQPTYDHYNLEHMNKRQLRQVQESAMAAAEKANFSDPKQNKNKIPEKDIPLDNHILSGWSSLPS